MLTIRNIELSRTYIGGDYRRPKFQTVADSFGAAVMTRDFQNVVTVLWHGPALEWIGAISGCVLLAGFVYFFGLVVAAS